MTDKLQSFINKYSNRKYPNQIKIDKLTAIFERIAPMYLSDSMTKDFLNTQQIRQITSEDPCKDFLKSLQRIVDIRNKR